MFKKSFIKKLVFIFIAIFSAVTITSALTIDFVETKLELGRGASHIGKTREFQKGNHSILMSINWGGFYFNSNETYSKIHVEYRRDYFGVTQLIGSTIFKVDYEPSSYSRQWGEQPHAYYYYEFTTKINGVSYAGMKFHYVRMQTEVDGSWTTP